MLILICLAVIIYMFYTSAKRSNRSTGLWIFLGIVMWLVFGGIFLMISEKFILHIATFSQAMALGREKLLLEGISAVIIIFLAYLIQENFISKKKQ